MALPSVGLGPSRPDARLLVVDDNEDNRYTLVMRLELEGYREITVAADGDEALALAAERDFDLVLLDVMMPKVDGYQVLQRLKELGRLQVLPVIMISALSELDSVVRCIELGAVDYLSKPFNPVLLKARVSASLEKKRLSDAMNAHLARMEAELEAARNMQLGMVPSDFPAPTKECPIEVFAMMEPAREVGGDLYDFFYDGRGAFYTVIGDVSDKGVPAAMFMARTKNLVRLVTDFLRDRGDVAPEPADILARVNRELCQDNGTLMFVTLFLGIFLPESGEFRFCNAGHAPPYRIARAGVEPLTGALGPPLGIREGAVYRTERVFLATGDALYLYTDGITEANDQTGQLFSEARLEAALRAAGDRGARNLVNEVAAAVRAFVEDAPQSDDIASMAIRFCDPKLL